MTFSDEFQLAIGQINSDFSLSTGNKMEVNLLSVIRIVYRAKEIFMPKAQIKPVFVLENFIRHKNIKVRLISEIRSEDGNHLYQEDLLYVDFESFSNPYWEYVSTNELSSIENLANSEFFETLWSNHQ